VTRQTSVEEILTEMSLTVLRASMFFFVDKMAMNSSCRLVGNFTTDMQSANNLCFVSL